MENPLIRVSCVSYLNSAPFIYGLKKHPVSELIDLSLDIPSACATKLLQDKVDIGLVPVAVIPSIHTPNIISSFCIGANGPVKSVTLLSNVPVDEIKTILLDYQSRTSVNLTRVLALKLWKIEPEWVDTWPGFENDIHDTTAAVVIGDRSLQIKDQFKYVYDLSEEWKKLTGLPFVFACWVANKKLSESFIGEFSQALAYGVASIPDVVNELQSLPGFYPGTADYLTNCISYVLDEEKREGMQLFLEYLKELNPIKVSG